tara:strand:+ start:755 stop:1843 length:1089 start_codon:yes stop_codon:yes gene_type:complete
MNIEFDVTLQCNFSCLNCNRHSNFNDLKSPHSDKQVGLDYYENTDISIEKTMKFIDDVKKNGTVERIHLIGGEPLVHPQMDKICDLMREELWGKHVKEILIISNIHPKMLKKHTLDTAEEIIQYFPFQHIEKVELEHIPSLARLVLQVVAEYLNDTKTSVEDFVNNIDSFELPINVPDKNLRSILEGTFKLDKGDMRMNCSFFHGIPVINYKPLSAKADEHRCTMVAPYDSGQEMNEKCDHPWHCGVNYAWDGYYPCANGAAIARLFNLEDKYRMDSLPSKESDWDGIDENGDALTKSEGMWDLCKLCQVSAKNQMWERDHGRPISVSYRKALGMEGNEKVNEYVVEQHKKKLAINPDFKVK